MKREKKERLLSKIDEVEKEKEKKSSEDFKKEAKEIIKRHAL